MKLKIILGIIIPVIIILVLAILGSLDIGFKAEHVYDKQLTLSDMFSEGNLRQHIKIGEIRITNDYFMSKRYNLPRLKACLVDKEAGKQIIDAANVFYSEGDYTYNNDIIYPDYYGRSGVPQSVQIESNGNKTVYVYLQPTINVNYYDYNNPNDPKSTSTVQQRLLQQYGEYDEIVLIEQEKNYQNYNCYNFDQSQIQKSVHISLYQKG